MNFIFCNHPLYARKVDPDYEAEYQAAGRDHACALFSYEDLERGKLTLYGEEISGLTIYRGWMMKPEVYRLFYKLLKERNIILINTPKEYEKYHLLPNWYNDFRENTCFSVWTDSAEIESVMPAAKDLSGPYLIKDYVKSRKHEWYDACYISDMSDTVRVEKVVRNFIERQGDGLVGGVVFRQYVELMKKGYHEKSGMPISEEYRVFIYAGEILAVDNYWTAEHKVNLSEAEYSWIESIASQVRSNFVTVDIARKENGELIIMEFGDGQVSGLQQIRVGEFYGRFK